VHGSFVTNPPLAIVNPLAGIDHGLALWFHAHLTPALVNVLRGITEFGSSEWIGVVLGFAVLFLVFKRWWPSLVTLIVAVPGGMLLNEWLKLLVHRHRPFVDGWFVDWSGYSFASGHTIGATLLYGQIALFLVPMIKARHWRAVAVSAAVVVISLVGFSRIALGAHYFTDVMGGMVLGTSWLAICSFAGRPLRRVSSPVPAVIMAEQTPVLVPVETESTISPTPLV
jgi:undecaprenyl-diphosphatase